MSRARRNTAEAQLARLLWLIPAAGRPEGILLADAARELEVTVERIQKDLDTLTERAYYLPGGTAEGLTVEFTDRVHIRTTGQFGRPPRLTPRELVCVAIALRSGHGAAEEEADGPRGGGRAAEAAALLEIIEQHLAFAGDAEGERGLAVPDLEEAWHTDDALALIREACAHRQPCEFGYLKTGAEAPELRRLHPWTLAQAEGRWYACGLDPEADGVRSFRVDRVLRARLVGEPGAFEVPEGFDPAGVFDGAAVFAAPGEPVTAVVEYAEAVVPWVRERWPGEATPGGGWRVRHAVGDPGWVVRHVLEHGEDAELKEPAELRAAVRSVAERMAG